MYAITHIETTNTNGIGRDHFLLTLKSLDERNSADANIPLILAVPDEYADVIPELEHKFAFNVIKVEVKDFLPELVRQLTVNRSPTHTRWKRW